MTVSLSPHANVNSRDEWVLLQKQCRAFIASGFLPDHITRGVAPEEAMARAVTIAVKGRELGIPPMQAFSSIAVIKGKPCLSSELMLALIYQRVKGAKVTFRTPPEKQNSECTVEMQRPDGEPMLFRFTLQDAKTAGIATSGGAWQKYPAAMLRARAVSAGARAVFPDCIMGCYTPEEMGHEIVDGDFEHVTPASPPPTRYLPGIEPRSTAETYVKNLCKIPGGMEEIQKQVVKYRKTGATQAADAIVDALDAIAPTVPALTDDELFPFEKGPDDLHVHQEND